MNIRELLRQASEATVTDDIYMFDMVYNQQSITDATGNVLGGGGEVRITYIKNPGDTPGYFSATSTKYTQVEQPFIPLVGSDNVTGDIINSKAYGGGFKIEDRPLIGSDDSTSN